MKSTLVNMTAVLFGITLVASAGVGAVNMITAEPIAQAEQAAKVEALKVVLPPFDQERFRRRDQHDGGLHARR